MKTKCYLAHVIGLKPTGEFSKTPLHCTIVPWFKIESYLLSGLECEISRLLIGSLPIHAVLGESVLYGPKEDIPATLVLKSPSLERLHLELLRIVEDAGGVPESMLWSGPQWSPHISQKKDHLVFLGGAIFINNVSLIQENSKNPKKKKILWNLPDKGL